MYSCLVFILALSLSNILSLNHFPASLLQGFQISLLSLSTVLKRSHEPVVFARMIVNDALGILRAGSSSPLVAIIASVELVSHESSPSQDSPESIPEPPAEIDELGVSDDALWSVIALATDLTEP